MNTPNPKSHEAAASKSSKTKDTSNDASQSTEKLQQLMAMFKPILEFHQAAETMMADDITMLWDVRLVRGKDQPFAHQQGTSTFNRMLASNMSIEAMSKIQYEIMEKIAKPLSGKFQEEVERMTFADLAARKEAAEVDDEGDEYPSWGESEIP